MKPILSVKDKNGNRIDIPAIVGPSAYQIAVKHGYKGTEEEWIADKELPQVTEENNGQFMRVVDGHWQAHTVLNAEEASF